MKKIFLILTVALLYAANGYAQTLPYLNEKLTLDERVKDALSRMTLEEKVALCHAQSKFSIPGVPRLGIRELWMSDGPHGVHEEQLWNAWDGAGWTNDSCTAFPALTCLAASWNKELSASYGRAIGEEARFRNKDVLLAPGVNIYRTPLNGRNFEYLGEDPFLASQMVVPYIIEVQKNGVAACVKHFAVNNQETNRLQVNVTLSDRALHEIYLPAFKAAVQQGGSWSIMGAYNKVRGEHACHSDLLLNKILKKDWAFDGVVVSDWGGVHNTKEAALNGLDIEMGSYTNGLTTESKFTYNDYFLADPYLKMLKDGTVPMSTVDDKASRILKLIFRTSMNRNRPWGSFANEEHHNVARTIAEDGIVLLKNDATPKKKALLPLDAAQYKKILVVGENATKNLMDGGGSSTLKVKQNSTPLAGLQLMYGDKIVYTKGYESGRPFYDRIDEIPQTKLDSLRKEAIRQAKTADIVIFVGGLNKNFQQDSEGGDRASYELPFGQNELINELVAVNPNLVLVLVSGNAVAMPWVKKVPTIVQAWFLGSEAGNALANVMSGKVNPSGKLPFSFPIKLEDCGAHAFDKTVFPGDANVEYKEDILVGYRWYDTKNIPVLFPFGHGLSYTNFKYGKATVSAKTITNTETLQVSLSVKNTGKNAGKEIVQLYIRDEKSALPRPIKELKGFEKIHLNAGEEKTVHFTIDKTALSYYDDAKKEWIAEPGKFDVLIGASATDIRATASFILK
ncbi:beta-glucosidase [Flavobacterium hercynium]|uniref:Glycosyl hydrolase n=1 Tax=Flavobacterium hercynium TaxID=387094 RepID=A0A226H818_9FLAO|nr:glycoside hydrolase family 3 C-terminal domain-containing protein [Flavobacterium hercynium]OXA90375.1 glycosyl hydrolase [Flavobacterium hercynium]SMP25968.1 beta-glucosidase [Flavobacterium hercynium]